jgi:hypothetical protein
MSNRAAGLCRTIAAVLLTASALTACSSFSIRRYGPAYDGGPSGYQRVPGIPFYTKRAVCRQETVYQQDLVKLTFRVHRLSYSSETGLENAATLIYASERLVDRQTAALPGVARLRMQPASEADWKSMAGAFEMLPQPNLANWQDTSALWLAKNETAPFLYVDYDNQYYLDVQRPVQGSASATTKLSSDGTLTEASAQIEDTTLGTIVGAIPFSDLIGEAFRLDDKGEQSGTPPPFRTSLDAAGVPIQHKLSTWRSDDPMPCHTSNAPIMPRSDNHGYTYTRVIGGSTPSEPKDDNAITVTGRVSLPKAAP